MSKVLPVTAVAFTIATCAIDFLFTIPPTITVRIIRCRQLIARLHSNCARVNVVDGVVLILNHAEYIVGEVGSPYVTGLNCSVAEQRHMHWNKSAQDEASLLNRHCVLTLRLKTDQLQCSWALAHFMLSTSIRANMHGQKEQHFQNKMFIA